jgi:hypothetical protein
MLANGFSSAYTIGNATCDASTYAICNSAATCT